MKMAGLFDVWFSSTEDAPLYTYTILTTDSSKRLEWYACWDFVAGTAISDIANLSGPFHALPSVALQNAWLGMNKPCTVRIMA